MLMGLLRRNVPLDTVWQELEKNLNFARKARFDDMVDDKLLSQQRFIAAMKDSTRHLHLQRRAFDEATFEARLIDRPAPPPWSASTGSSN